MPDSLGVKMSVFLGTVFKHTAQRADPSRALIRIGSLLKIHVHHQRIDMVVLNEKLQPKAQLAHVVDALNLPRPASGAIDNRQQKCRQNPNDADDHQKFNQRESRLNS